MTRARSITQSVMTYLSSAVVAVFILVTANPTKIEAATVDWYTVELVVFSYEGDEDGEFWVLDPGMPDLENAYEPSKSGELALAEEDETNKVPFRALRRRALALNKLREQLDDEADYEALVHVAWEQPGYEAEQAQLVRIETPQLLGTIRLHRARFLHVAADLLYEPDPDAEEPRRFRLVESRRMRSKELHYLDHPAFGILVTVTPMESPS